ncbi:hypothetical protein [Streptomonospora wellingtoniae]|uniref:DUF4064 domain-containing protein n=1 Tax=Streptomonospora wellingtoniae TaxID=3075544 RepID=A0ABU2KPT0_9ACTN|nr:hypothetical protein [Streptomonospora sp. DSM 45055]MDT0301211.1 hypothetical protein [Streptomonospora sp. DSM 45055]
MRACRGGAIMEDKAHPPRMLITALVLGGIGVVIGLIGGFGALLVGGLGSAFEIGGPGNFVGLAFTAGFIGVAAVIGGALVRGASKTAALLLLVSGVGGFLAVSTAWMVAGPLLIVGALLAWFGSGHTSEETTHRPPTEPKGGPGTEP